MPELKSRSYQKELLDGDNNSFEDIQRNMQELNFINKVLGGHSTTIKGYKAIADGKTNLSICELGCGGGDNLIAIRSFTDRKNIQVNLTGIDINEDCILYAKSLGENKEVNFIKSDYKTVHFKIIPDIIFSSLFCHHFTDEELISQLKWMKAYCRKGFFINDLHRHPVAYYFILIVTRIFSRSSLVKHDAPLSVLRGFKKKEWINLFAKAGIINYKIKWCWGFRYLITYKNG